MINKKTKQSMITWKLFSSVRFDEEPFLIQVARFFD